jgi:peptidoglycan/LPS O-acetylase OafA/YrhL
MALNTNRKLRHVSELDGVRAIAALMVFIFHVNGYVSFGESWGAIGKGLRTLAALGQTGVPLFFVLS